MSAYTSPTEFLQLPTELILGVLQSLPDFSALFSITQTNKVFNSILKENEYSICQGIAQTVLGPLWPEALALLTLQGRLKRQAEIELDIRNLFGDTTTEETGHGVLEGGTNIGLAEVRQLLQYTDKTNVWRYSLLKEDNIDYALSASEQLLYDRALLRYWVILLVSAPQVISFIDHRNLARRQGDEENFFIAEFNRTREELEDIRNQQFDAVKPFLSYPIKELHELAVVTRDSRGFPGLPGTTEQGGAHYYEWWPRMQGIMLQSRASEHIHRAIQVHNLENGINGMSEY